MKNSTRIFEPFNEKLLLNSCAHLEFNLTLMEGIWWGVISNMHIFKEDYCAFLSLKIKFKMVDTRLSLGKDWPYVFRYNPKIERYIF